MRFFSLILIVCAVGFFPSCRSKDVYAEKSKSLDSLGGVVNSQRTRLKNSDTLLIAKAILKFTYYTSFISCNVNDTLNKVEADHLQHFSMSGNRLQLYYKNRKELIQRADRVSGQLSNLSEDAKKRLLSELLLDKFYATEAGAATEFMRLSDQQLDMYQSSMQEFKNAINGVESLIRKRNNGELPTIIQDTISL